MSKERERRRREMEAKRLRKLQEEMELERKKREEEERKKKEENRFAELGIYLSDQFKFLEPNQADRLMETSNSFKDIAQELVPKFRQIVERLKELS